MTSGQARIDIWNAALDILREQPLSSVNDTGTIPRLFTRNYAQQRDYLLARYHWKFAMKRALIAEDSTAPDWQWSKRYAVPADCLRILPPTEEGYRSARPIPFEEESGYILCNVTGGLRLRYIARVTEEGRFSNDFCELLAVRLAYKVTHWLTGKQSMMQTIGELYTQTLAEVKDVAASQVASEDYYDDDIAYERVLLG